MARWRRWKALIRDMAEVGMEVLCYNWMPSEDWVRTTAEFPARGGSRSTAFDIGEVVDGAAVTDADGRPEAVTSADQLWENLGRFLEEVVPVAEDAGIKLAIHPDDPPLSVFHGQPQIITDWRAMLRVTELVPSEANGICYCTGSLGLHGMGDLLEGIRQLAGRIHFVHLRNVRGTPEKFEETWHDDGQLDLPSVVRALKEIGYGGTVRPDHAPSMEGEENRTPGYEMGGRLFAAGYLRGLFQAVALATDENTRSNF